MAQFEERLAMWDAVEAHLNRALEQVPRRQATLDALQADIHRLFEVAEKTTDDVRSIAAAKEEVTQTRAMLENVLSLVTHVHDAANGLEHRKKQVQQALMDQVTEQAGALAFHTKQAEAVLTTLREEIADKTRTPVTPPREGR